MLEQQTRQSIDFYRQAAITYDQSRWCTPVGRYIDESQRRILRTLVGECAGRAALDVASGTGRMALELARAGAAVTALDSSNEMLAICAAKAADEGLGKRLTSVQAFATALPFPERGFDICVCINALNHIPEAGTAIREMARVLRPNGVLVTNFTNWASYYLPVGLLVNLRRRSVQRAVYTKWFTPGEIRVLHQAAGLDVDRVVGFAQIPTSIHNAAFLALWRGLDRLSRQTQLRRVAPQLFVRATKRDGK